MTCIIFKDLVGGDQVRAPPPQTTDLCVYETKVWHQQSRLLRSLHCPTGAPPTTIPGSVTALYIILTYIFQIQEIQQASSIN